jgi:hypothetical protein
MEEIKIDKRHNYVLVLDTETANTLTDENGSLNMDYVLFYDCGFQVADTKGRVYEKYSYVNRDIFVYERDLMQSAYYSNKIPQYVEEIRSGKRVMSDTWTIRNKMIELIKKYDIKAVVAHNARFDYRALNNTIRYVSKKHYSFFPYGMVEWWDTLKMCRSVVCKMPTYIEFCEENNFLTKNGRPQATAESVYAFITNNPDYKEEHTALEDVEIETEIMHYCYRQHKPMNKVLYSNEPNPNKPQTSLEIIWRS